MTNEIKAKVLSYKVMYCGFSCGEAKVELLEGPNKGKRLVIPIYTQHYKQGDIIALYESDED